jgi:hypothetical protein
MGVEAIGAVGAIGAIDCILLLEITPGVDDNVVVFNCEAEAMQFNNGGGRVAGWIDIVFVLFDDLDNND